MTQEAEDQATIHYNHSGGTQQGRLWVSILTVHLFYSFLWRQSRTGAEGVS